MQRLRFVIPITIQPKQGDRSMVRGGYVHHYQPKNVTDHAEALALLMAPNMPNEPLGGPLRILVRFCFPWLKGATARKRAFGRWPKDTKPDSDNCAKQLFDVLERRGFIADDSRLADSRVIKEFGKVGKIIIELEEIDPIPWSKEFAP